MVKIDVVPLQPLQVNLIQQVLKKLPVRPLCRLRGTCQFFNSHIEQNRNFFASRVFDTEQDLLWSNSISCPDLTILDVFTKNAAPSAIYRWRRYPDNVTWDSDLQASDWTQKIVELDGRATEKLSGIAFGTVTISTFSENAHFIKFLKMDTLKALNIHCETLQLRNLSFHNVKSLADAINCKRIAVSLEQIQNENFNWEDCVSQMVKSDLRSKIHLDLSFEINTQEYREWGKKFKGLTAYGKNQDIKTFLQDLTTTEQCTLEYLQFNVIRKFLERNLTLGIPHETLWVLESLPLRYRKPFIPHVILLVQLPGKLAVVAIYENRGKVINVNIIERSQRSALMVVKKKLRIWDSRREEEYLSADVNGRKEILREQFLASRR